MGIGGRGTSDTDNFSQIISIPQNQEEIMDFENFVQVTQKTMQKAEERKQQATPHNKRAGKKDMIESDELCSEDSLQSAADELEIGNLLGN